MFDGIPFGAPPAALEARGAPARKNINSLGETEYCFREVVFRFVADKFVEASFETPPQMDINGEIVPFTELLNFMKERDPAFFEALGFGVAPALGLAYDLEHDGSWTTAFVEGRWDKIKDKANKRMQRTRR